MCPLSHRLVIVIRRAWLVWLAGWRTLARTCGTKWSHCATLPSLLRADKPADLGKSACCKGDNAAQRTGDLLGVDSPTPLEIAGQFIRRVLKMDDTTVSWRLRGRRGMQRQRPHCHDAAGLDLANHL